jgi:hypothetical protein
VITITNFLESDYFLPEDGMAAKAEFLRLLNLPGELWLSGYGCNMPDLFKILTERDAEGTPQHLLLDYVQSTSNTARPLLKTLNHAQHHTDITLTTAGLNSSRTSQIWHWKAFVKLAEDGEPWCWEGSVNFSDSGWLQGNSCRVFRSSAWSDKFREQHAAHKAWADANKPDYQATIMEVGGDYDYVDAYFDALQAAAAI